MRKGLFTLIALVVMISAMFALTLNVNAAEYELTTVAVVDGVEYDNFDAAVAAAQSTPVVGKINTDDVGVVAIVKDGEYNVNTSTIVAVVVATDYATDVVINYAEGVEEVKDITTEVDGTEYTATVVVNKSYVVAAIDEDIYSDLDAAIEAAEATTIDGVKETPVVVFGEETYTVDTDALVALVSYEGAKFNVGAKYFKHETTVEYDGSFYDAAVIVNTEAYQAIVGETLYATVNDAIAAVEVSKVADLDANPVIVIATGTVNVTANKMVAIAVYDSEKTELVFGNDVFTYSVDVVYEGDIYTAYAVINTNEFAQAVVIDLETKDYKFYSSVNAAVAAADGKLTKAVVVLKKGAVAPSVEDFVILATVDNRATFNKAGYFTFDASVEYAGFDITGIAVYNTDYIFGGTADSINDAFPSVNATYTGTAFNIALSTDNILHLASAKEYADILVHFAPLFVLGDEAYINGYQVYAGRQVQVGDIVKAIRSCVPTLNDLENLEGKTIFTVDVKIGSAGTYVEFPVNVNLEVSQENFDKIKDTAALINEYFDLDTKDGNVIFAIDAKPVVDIIFEKELAKGKTVKEVRDFINSTSINDIADKVASYNLTGKKAKVADLFVKAVNKVADSQYASYLDLTLGMLDMDATGVYHASASYTIDFGTKLETVVNKFNAKFPTLAEFVSIDVFASIQKVTFGIDGTIAVFDVYTVTFVDANGNVIYTESLLEGETPVFVGDLPTKETDGEYIYEFAGWTDGVTEFAGELAPLTEDTTYAPYFTEIALEQIDEDLKFAFGTVSFADSFKLKMTVEKAVAAGYDRVWVVAVMEDGTELELEYTVNGDYFEFVVDDIAAKEVVDVIEFTLYAEADYDNGVTISVKGETKDYGVKIYAMNRLEKSEDDTFKTLCVDALIYAAEAQKTFSYKVDTLATADLTAEQLAYGTTTAPVLENRLSLGDQTDMPVRIHQAALELESNVKIKVYFKLGDYAADEVYVQINHVKGEPIILTGEDLVENGVYYTVSFAEYAAKELREDITVAVYDLDGNQVSATLVYGAEAYAFRQIEKVENVDLCNAIMNYATSAKAYFVG